MKGQEILVYFKKKLYLCRLKRLEPLKQHRQVRLEL